MTKSGKNSGIMNVGDNNEVSGNVLGSGTQVFSFANTSAEPEPADSIGDAGAVTRRWDVGVVTILAEEAWAVHAALDLTREPGRIGGLVFYTGEIADGGAPVRVVATRTHGQGQRSVMAACENLRRHYQPTLLALVGIGGGIGDADVGDVVVGTRIVYYDLRKETPDGTLRRGEEREAPAEIVHSVNAFFTDHGEPAEFPGQLDGYRRRTFRALPSPIGSGEAVVANSESEIRTFLSRYNDKILAVDMEAGGLSQFWQENSVDPDLNLGWVVVRGISDHADSAKDDRHHELAAHNAAHVLRALIPYMC